MQASGTWRRWTSTITLSLLVAMLAAPARADIKLAGEKGWSASFDGFMNLYMVDTWGGAAPAGVADLYSSPTDDNVFRIRTGFLPALFGFKVEAPEWEGMKVKARVGIYPQLNNPADRTSISPNIDFREFFITIDGGFGQVLVGRALNLYMQEAILGDMSLFGIGIPAANNAGFNGAPTLGHIGFGYLYSAFGAQFRYTTPSMGGLKVAVALSDPSAIGTATITTMPLVEGTLSFSSAFDSGSFRAWVSGLYNTATFPAGGTVDASGGAAGLGLTVSGFDVMASGFAGKGLGTDVQLTGGLAGVDPVSSKGFLVQATYKPGKTKFGVSFGQTMVDQTAAQAAAADQSLEQRMSLTLGVYHDLTSWLRLVAEYSWYQLDWYGPASQTGNVLGAGGFFFW